MTLGVIEYENMSSVYHLPPIFSDFATFLVLSILVRVLLLDRALGYFGVVIFFKKRAL